MREGLFPRAGHGAALGYELFKLLSSQRIVKIKPGTTLVFEVDLLDIVKPQ